MTQSEVETTFRFDHEERVLWCCTTSVDTANRWRRHGMPVTVLSRTMEGTERSWQMKLTATTPGWRTAWRQALVRAMPGWPSFTVGAGQAQAGGTEGSENEDPDAGPSEA